jgi:hypothetical protein
MRERSAVAFGKLDERRGFSKSSGNRNRRAFRRPRLEQRLHCGRDLVAGRLDPQGALAAEQRHCCSLVGKHRRISLG